MSLKNKLPSTLLLLSRAFVITAESSGEDAKTKVFQDITDTLASLPEDVITSAAVDEGLATHTSTKKEDYTKRMEFVKREEEIIAEEQKETEAVQEEIVPAPETTETETVDKAAEEMEGAPSTKQAAAPSADASGDDEEKAIRNEEKATYEREKRAKRAAQLSRLLTMVSDTSSVCVERTELMMLVKKGVDAYACLLYTSPSPRDRG